MSLVAQVLVPVPVAKLFDYQLTQPAVVGQRVLVSFGEKTQHVGLIFAIKKIDESTSRTLKPVIEVLEDFAVVDEPWRELLLFASRYYQEPLGKAYKNAFPKRLRMAEPVQLPRQTHYYFTQEGSVAYQEDSLPKNAVKQRKLLTLFSQQATLSSSQLRAAGFLSADINRAVKKGYIVSKQVAAYQSDAEIFHAAYRLNTEQCSLIERITPQLHQFQVHYIYGVTGSGKTEVYLHLIEAVIKQDKQVLLLVPEIALTPQMLERFIQRFGQRVASYHSGLSEVVRRDVFLAAQAGELPIVIGTRSAIFLPIKNLGLILVDEAHDASYKQQEGFLYQARDLAVYRAKKQKVGIVMGSATPSLESLYNIEQKKYQPYYLKHRATQTPLPAITLIDRRGELQSQVLSPRVIQAMRHVLQKGKQVMLFLNRRGFAPVMLCNACDWRSHCPNCSVYQTAHLSSRQLCCHHCGHLAPLPLNCPSCQSSDIYFGGAGTQKLESQLNEQFPRHKVLRLDRDKQKTATQLQQALTAIQGGEIDIILGTQLLVKGHHFPAVEMVCVVDADSALFSSNFRAEEHLYQQLIQVAGRAGRESAGKVYIQSSVPDHAIFHALVKHDYWHYAQTLLSERSTHQLPPYTALTVVRASAVEQSLVLDFLRGLKQGLNEHATAVEVRGPIPLTIEKLKNRYQAKLWLLAKNKVIMQRQLFILSQLVSYYDRGNRFRTVIDVDALE